jgi:hypothetical protein
VTTIRIIAAPFVATVLAVVFSVAFYVYLLAVATEGVVKWVIGDGIDGRNTE